MGTKFTSIYNRFLGKITDDMYMEFTPQDTIKDLRSLLLEALPGFEFPRQDLFDYTLKTTYKTDSELTQEDFVISLVWKSLNPDGSEQQISVVEDSEFATLLTSEEINILAILMMNGWLQRQITSVENVRMKYSGADFKFTSQANHLSKLQNLLAECQRQSHHYQRLYKRREFNAEGKYQSTWYWFGDHNVTTE